MSKTHRGKGIRNLVANGRGTCPICKKERVKLLYEQTVDGNAIKVCKICNANAKNKAKNAPKPAPEAQPQEASA